MATTLPALQILISWQCLCLHSHLPPSSGVSHQLIARDIQSPSSSACPKLLSWLSTLQEKSLQGSYFMGVLHLTPVPCEYHSGVLEVITGGINCLQPNTKPLCSTVPCLLIQPGPSRLPTGKGNKRQAWKAHHHLA